MSRLIAIALFFVTALPLHAGSGQVVLLAVTADGWRLGELEARYLETGKSYDVRLLGAATGLWGFFLQATYDGHGAGRIAKGGPPVPDFFEAKSHRIFKTRHQRVDFTGGQPVKVFVDPARDRTALSDPLLVTDTRIDPLSYLGVFLQDRESGCPPPGELYDGRRETRVVFNPVTSGDGDIVCEGVYEIIKGPDHSIRKGFRQFGVRLVYRRVANAGLARLDQVDFRSGRNTIVLQRLN
ncbi:MAG: hypothetical protein ACE5DK_01875 [Paracoccaceae bacterium]